MLELTCSLIYLFHFQHQAYSQIAEDDDMKDSETDLNEVPLGKMIKRLRAKSIKARKQVKDEASAPEARKESDFDILKMVQEINSDNVGLSGTFEPSNGYKHVPRKARNDPTGEKRKRMAVELGTVPVKRRRSSSAQGRLKFSLTKGVSRGSARPSADSVSQKGESSSESTEIDGRRNNSEEKYSLQVNSNEAAESEWLVSRARKSSDFSGRGSTKDRNGVHSVEESSDQDLEVSFPVMFLSSEQNGN